MCGHSGRGIGAGLESEGYVLWAGMERRGWGLRDHCKGTEFMAIVNKGVQERRAWMGPTCQRLCSHKMKSQKPRHPSSPLLSAPLISTFSRGAASTNPSHSPSPTLNHCWDNRPGSEGWEGAATTIPLPLVDPQTDTSFIEILWCPNPQLPLEKIMDSLRQPFPARPSSEPTRVTSLYRLWGGRGRKKQPHWCLSLRVQHWAEAT